MSYNLSYTPKYKRRSASKADNVLSLEDLQVGRLRKHSLEVLLESAECLVFPECEVYLTQGVTFALPKEWADASPGKVQMNLTFWI